MSGPSRPVGSPIINITGDLVALGPLRRDLVPLYQRWLNDFSHARNFDDTPEPWTTKRMNALYDERATDPGSNISFTIYERAALRPIGYTMLLDISHRHRSAEFAIHIGEDDDHGKGYGTETARLMLDYAFESLNLHSVFLTVAEYNLAGRRAYARAGFRETGRRRQAWRLNGRFWDEIIMDCLAGEVTGVMRNPGSEWCMSCRPEPQRRISPVCAARIVSVERSFAAAQDDRGKPHCPRGVRIRCRTPY